MGYKHKFRDFYYQILDSDDKFKSVVYDPIRFTEPLCETKLCDSIVEASTLVKLEIIRLEKWVEVENQKSDQK